MQIRTAGRQENRFHTAVLEQCLKGLGACRVPVVEQIVFPQQEPLKWIGQLPGPLLHEGCRGMGRDARDLHAPCSECYNDEHIICHQVLPGRHLHREAVRRGNHLPVQFQELGPAHARLAALRRGLSMVAPQDGAHGQLVNTKAYVRQGPLDAPIASGRMLCCHAHDELLHLLSNTRTSELAALLTAVALLGDQALVPTQEGIWRHEGCYRFEAFPDFPGFSGKMLSR